MNNNNSRISRSFPEKRSFTVDDGYGHALRSIENDDKE